MKQWFLYIIECRGGSLYTGISNDVERRVRKHNAGKACLYTKYRFPVKLLYEEACGTRSDATKRERKVKTFPRAKKLELIDRKGRAKRRSRS